MEEEKQQSKKMEQNAAQVDNELQDQELKDLTAESYISMFQKKWPSEYEELKTVGQNQKFEPHLYRKNDCLKLIKNIKKDSVENFAFGCIIGNYLADACGSRDEFVQKTLKKEHMNDTMAMPGGGYHKTGPGQGTDDSELSTCIMLGLIDANLAPMLSGKQFKAHMNMDRVAMRYRDWYESNPFDCGQTVRGSLSALTRHTRELAQPPSWDLIVRETGCKDIYKVTQRVNTNSKSNGSLMKICPLAIWASEMIKGCTDPDKENEFAKYKCYRECIDDDVKIIHYEPLTRSCVYVYSVAISHMFNNYKDPNRAIDAFNLALKLGKTTLANEEADNGAASVCKWIEEAQAVFDSTEKNKQCIYDGSEDMVEEYKCTSAIGFIKHAFILSFYYLLQLNKYKDDDEKLKTMYKDSVREVISLGGDTDTNACIVAGMVGAYVGIDRVDETMMGVYFNWDPTDKTKQVTDGDKIYGRDRPLWMNLGQNSIDAIFWLCKLRIQNQDDCDRQFDEMVKLKEGDKIKN